MRVSGRDQILCENYYTISPCKRHRILKRFSSLPEVTEGRIGGNSRNVPLAARDSTVGALPARQFSAMGPYMLRSRSAWAVHLLVLLLHLAACPLPEAATPRPPRTPISPGSVPQQRRGGGGLFRVVERVVRAAAPPAGKRPSPCDQTGSVH